MEISRWRPGYLAAATRGRWVTSSYQGRRGPGTQPGPGSSGTWRPGPGATSGG